MTSTPGAAIKGRIASKAVSFHLTVVEITDLIDQHAATFYRGAGGGGYGRRHP